MGAADRPGCFAADVAAPGRAAAGAGARCGSRPRGCGRAGDSAEREASAGPVCAIELLIHRKKKGEEKKGLVGEERAQREAWEGGVFQNT